MNLEEKQIRYKVLVEKRKRFLFSEGLQNPSKICNGEFDCDEIGAWSQWEGNLDAEILLIGQDWSDVETFIYQEGKESKDSKTNITLQELFLCAGIKISEPNTYKSNRGICFFTNAILGIKGSQDEEVMSDPVKASWVKESTYNFTKELIEIIQPKIIITLGTKALYAMKLIYKKEITILKLKDLVEKNPIALNNGINLFAFYHCGGLGLANRSLENQKMDWGKINLEN